MDAKRLIYRVIATFGFVGYLPLAPGTWGTAAGLLVWFILPWHSFWFNLILVAVTFFTGIFASEYIEKRIGEIDPPYIVIDEVVGIWLTMTIIPRLKFPEDLVMIIITFAVFRFFDITKFKPLRKLEMIGGGFGIMADDILAGIFTAIIINLGMLIL
ncbi:MAG: phosphatidylglycerophosphatase A [Candidatus Marinimicrobia bacterium]|nr:phosphatidylglycerophosphatase A [Candidatus Neomarinimicrobiota bacterium]MDD5230514.1 phosphatidylglycerophosphatase A [Candidatus Neomarinimicrobiota bacterium]